MAIMIRTNAKATKLAWAILGEPANVAFKKDRKQRLLDKRLTNEETVRVR